LSTTHRSEYRQIEWNKEHVDGGINPGVAGNAQQEAFVDVKVLPEHQPAQPASEGLASSNPRGILYRARNVADNNERIHISLNGLGAEIITEVNQGAPGWLGLSILEKQRACKAGFACSSDQCTISRFG
jgi:hypothetical protein